MVNNLLPGVALMWDLLILVLHSFSPVSYTTVAV